MLWFLVDFGLQNYTFQTEITYYVNANFNALDDRLGMQFLIM